MDFKSELFGRYLRIIAIVALLLGLGDAARLLGVSGGPESPLTVLGTTGFAYLAVFCIARLFSAVGLWTRASWGAVLLAGATAVELLLYLAGVREIQIDAIGFVVRLVILASLGALLFLNFRQRRSAHD